MLASTQFHILPCFSSFSALPTPTYHPPPNLTISHPLQSSTHDSVPAQWAWRLLVCRVSLLVCLHPLLPLPPWGDPWHSWPWCFKGGILASKFYDVFFWWPTQSPINQTNKNWVLLVNSDSAFMVCHSRFKIQLVIHHIFWLQQIWLRKYTCQHPMSLRSLMHVGLCGWDCRGRLWGLGHGFFNEDGASTVLLSCGMVWPTRMNWCIHLCT